MENKTESAHYKHITHTLQSVIQHTVSHTHKFKRFIIHKTTLPKPSHTHHTSHLCWECVVCCPLLSLLLILSFIDVAAAATARWRRRSLTNFEQFGLIVFQTRIKQQTQHIPASSFWLLTRSHTHSNIRQRCTTKTQSKMQSSQNEIWAFSACYYVGDEI